MVQVLLPARLLQEAAACAMLGAALGAVRAFLPARGRAAFVPDVLLSGAVLLACQSYAAGYSKAGVLRWYMVAAAFVPLPFALPGCWAFRCGRWGGG